ncbi:TonB-dependent receptor [Sphingomonas crocodyli]|uniref:TonB-dependent receptor n=1 Tax=Sphingomonas crocodyli TaxID=1979270 RepID=A0A437LUV8_9SPHN|nr:TonB-dependent receptor [Sphingomonas crocodyli]RVT89142.1 TonB-dependent receptor [Sphingomonas crocodyli]
MNRKTIRHALSLTALACGMLAIPAFAQEAAPAAADAGASDGDIIVTAQRRNEKLSDVPIAIVAQTSEQLERSGIISVKDLATVTPGLKMGGNGPNSQPAIRGVSSGQTDPGNDANVATYVDGVYQSSQTANNAADLADVERIEVLKGPQGTLFGRNATGGAIRIVTKKPSYTPTGSIEASYGNLDEVLVKGYISAPIVADKVAFSLSGVFNDSDGYARDIVRNTKATGINSKTVRAKLLIEPVETLSIELFGTYGKRKDGNSAAYTALKGNSAANLTPGLNPVVPFRANTYTYSLNRDGPFFKADTWSIGGTIALETEVGTLTSITAYNNAYSDYNTEGDFSNLDLVYYRLQQNQKDFSQELTFSTEKMGDLQAVAGVFYYDSIGKYDPLEATFGPSTPTNPATYIWSQQKTKAYAAFGELNWTPTDQLSVIVGARYNSETRRASGNFSFGVKQKPAFFPIGAGKVKYDSFTPRISVRYDLDSGDNIYATYSKGFKSGGYNISAFQPTPFKPEKIDAFEVGLKTNTSRIISANLSAFYYKYKDLQVLAIVNGFNVTANAATSKIWGADAEITGHWTPQFTTTGSIAYLDAKYDKYPGAVFNAQFPGCRCGSVTTTGDLSDGRMPFSPKLTAGLTANWRETYDFGTVELTGTGYYTSKFFWDNAARIEQKAYATLGARAAFTPANSGFTVYAYGRNLTNATYLRTVFALNTGDGGSFAPPRTYGVGAKFAF